MKDDEAIRLCAAAGVEGEEGNMTHEEKIEWLAVWCAKHDMKLELQGECGFCRECVGISSNGTYPDYHWGGYNDEEEDQNGRVWKPENAFHKHDCVAVLGRGEPAESQLYEWVKWFDENGFTVETGDLKMDPKLDMLGLLLGKNRYVRMVKARKK